MKAVFIFKNLFVVYNLKVWFFSLDQGILNKLMGTKARAASNCPFLSCYQQFGLSGCSVFVFWMSKKLRAGEMMLCLFQVQLENKHGIQYWEERNSLPRESQKIYQRKKIYQLLDFSVLYPFRAVSPLTFFESVWSIVFFWLLTSGENFPNVSIVKSHTIKAPQIKTIWVTLPSRNN